MGRCFKYEFVRVKTRIDIEKSRYKKLFADKILWIRFISKFWRILNAGIINYYIRGGRIEMWCIVMEIFSDKNKLEFFEYVDNVIGMLW